MTDTPPLVFHIINDLPAVEDAFGPHADVAKTLASMIACDPDDTSDVEGTQGPDGIFVALEGGWGSGKSSVITQLETTLDEQEIPAKTIIFDAWAHEGDHLRRAFLEVLITHLKTDKWIDPEKAQEKSDELAGRLVKTVVKRTLQPSVLAGILAIALLLAPLGSALLNDTVSAVITQHLGFSKTTTTYLGFALSGSPIFLVLFSLVWWLIKRLSPGVPAGNAFSALFEHTAPNTKTRTTLTPAPTSLEFQAAFNDLMDEALADKTRRVVLVIDNLDRIAPDSAVALWATMQTFLNRNTHSKNSWRNRLWIIVPYDRDVLNRYYKQGKTEPEQGNGGQHFSKIFDVRLHVPKPLIVKWQPYFKKLLGIAFPTVDEPSIRTAMKIISVHRESETSYTPRDLKRLINSIGPVYLRWGNEFELALILLYGLDVQNSFEHSDSSGTSESNTYASIIGIGYEDQITAIRNNMEQSIANEREIEKSIGFALKDLDYISLRKIMATTPSFPELIEAAVADAIEHENIFTFCAIAKTLVQADILKDMDEQSADDIRDIFVRKINLHHQQISKPKPRDDTMSGRSDPLKNFVGPAFLRQYKINDSLPDLLSFCDKKYTAAQVFELLMEGPLAEISSDDFDHVDWYCSLTTIIDYLVKANVDQDRLKSLSKIMLDKEIALGSMLDLTGTALLKKIGLPIPDDASKTGSLTAM